jgi:hypothetical protein
MFTDTQGKTHTFNENTLLVFIDDTGNDKLSDKNFPIFGFGGCIVRASDYEENVILPWRKVSSCFSPEMLPLHACDINPKNLTSDQINALSSFFQKKLFGRFAEVISDQAILQTKSTIMYIITATMHLRIIDVAKYFLFNNIVMFIEESDRKREITAAFEPHKFAIGSQSIPIERFFLPKKAEEAGLIVADFIAHTAGASVMSRLKGIPNAGINRKDFKDIFTSVDPKYCSFIEINEVKDND